MLDFLIVGTGPSGYFLSKTILDKNPHANVLVIEAGEDPINPKHPLANKISYDQDFKLNPTINIGYGGTSQLWHNVLAPLDSEDFVYKPWIGLSGWPIRKEELVPHYRKVSNFFGFDYEIFESPEKFFDYDTEINKIKYNPKVFDHKVLMHPLNYLRTNKNFDELSSKHSSLKIIKGSVALRFKNSPEGDTLVYFDSKTRSHKSVIAKKFILSAGALNNPEILFNSEHISRKIPYLGKCLMDHPMGNFYQFRYKNPVSAKIYQSYKIKRLLAINTPQKINKNLREELRLANSVFYLQPSFSEGFNNETEKLKLKLLTVREKLMKFRLPLNETFALAKNFNMTAQIIQYKTGLLSKHKISDCMFVTEQIPSEKSSVNLTNRANKYGNKATEINWHVSSKDIDEVQKIYHHIKNDIMFLNNAKPTYDPNNFSWRDRLSSAAHHLGTVRMASDKSKGCVDSNLKVFGTENIYVCDGSVFSTAGNANPTFTCMALASRLGDHLNGQ